MRTNLTGTRGKAVDGAVSLSFLEDFLNFFEQSFAEWNINC